MSDKKETDEVSLTMTKAQKEQVVKLFAAEAEKKNTVVETVSVQINFEHTRNDKKYFGLVKVPADLAASLMVADQRYLEARLRENQSRDGLVEIVGRGVSRIVK